MKFKLSRNVTRNSAPFSLKILKFLVLNSLLILYEILSTARACICDIAMMNWCAPVVQTQELLKYCSHDLSPFDNAGLREVKLSTSIKYLPKYLYLKNWQSTWQFESNNTVILTNSILKLPQTIKCLPQDWNPIHMINVHARHEQFNFINFLL